MGQGGNVWEWNETNVGVNQRIVRGGRYDDPVRNLLASYRIAPSPTYESTRRVGFRVGSVSGDLFHQRLWPRCRMCLLRKTPRICRRLLTGVFSDPQAETLTFSATSDNASLVTVLVNGTQLVLDFQENQHGQATITVTATDPWGASAVDTFVATVEPVNDAPLAKQDSYVLAANAPYLVPAPGLLGNDSDLEGTHSRRC